MEFYYSLQPEFKVDFWDRINDNGPFKVNLEFSFVFSGKKEQHLKISHFDPFRSFGLNDLKEPSLGIFTGGLIWESLLLWLKPPKMCGKSLLTVHSN